MFPIATARAAEEELSSGHGIRPPRRPSPVGIAADLGEHGDAEERGELDADRSSSAHSSGREPVD